MSRNIAARISRLETGLLVGVDRQRYEELRRSHYNLFRVSNAALVADLASKLESSALPTWARQEFNAAIPPDSDRKRLVEAESWARGMVCGGPEGAVQHNDLDRSLRRVFDRAHENGCGSLTDFAEHLREKAGSGIRPL